MKTVDARGLVCPQPVIEAKKALRDMENDRLEVRVDNEIAVQNLLKLGSYLKHEVTAEQAGEKDYIVVFMVGAPAGTAGKADSLSASDEKMSGCVVVFSADHMGEGDEVLGRLLIKGFVYALTELERLPETILLYNGGARLSVEGSDSLEDLRAMEEQGVEILTCGTCLNHYEIADKLAVGSVTNMYSIVEKLAAAKTVIRP